MLKYVLYTLSNYKNKKRTQGLRKDRGSYLAWLWLLYFWEREPTSKVWDLNRIFFFLNYIKSAFFFFPLFLFIYYLLNFATVRRLWLRFQTYSRLQQNARMLSTPEISYLSYKHILRHCINFFFWTRHCIINVTYLLNISYLGPIWSRTKLETKITYVWFTIYSTRC